MIAVTLILGVGTGVNAALFGIVDGLVLRPLPYEEANKIVHFRAPLERYLANRERLAAIPHAAAALPLTDRTHVKRRAVFQPGSSTVVSLGVRPVFVSTEFFELLGVFPALGRPFGPWDSQARPRPVILSDGLWRRLYGGDPDIINTSIRLVGALEDPSWTVVGVMPAGFEFPKGANFWLPYSPDEFLPSLVPDFARLENGASIEAMRSALPDVDVVTLRDYVRPDGAGGIVFLLVNTMLLLLVTWVHVTALTYARATERQAEFAIREALGATPTDLRRTISAEGAILGTAALAFGWWLATPLAAVIEGLLPAQMTLGQRLEPGWRVLVYSCGFQGAALTLWSLASSEVVQRRTRVGGLALRQGCAAGPTGSRGRYRLLTLQVALATAVTCLAAGTLTGFLQVQQHDLGFEPRGLLAFPMPAPATERGSSSAESRSVERRYADLAHQSRARVLATTGVEDATFATHWPMAEVAERRAISIDSESVEIVSQAVGLHYVQTVRARLSAGRNPTAEEVSAGQRPGAQRRVGLVNRTLARLLERQGPVIGRSLSLSRTSTIEVVGVLDDVEDDLRDGRTLPALYTFLPESAYAPVLLVRLNENGSAALLQSVLQEVWGDIRAAREIIDLEDVVWRASTGSRAQVTLMGIITALLLPVLFVGVVGAVRYAIQQQTREYAMRLVLGADRGQLQRAAVGRLLLHTVVGTFGGLAAGTAALGAAARMTAVVATLDPTATVTTVCVVVAVVLVASLFGVTPLRGVEPVRVLRESV